MWEAHKLVKDKVLSIKNRKEWPDNAGRGMESHGSAGKWANDAVVRVNQHIRKQAVSEAEKKIAFLKNELASTSVVEAQELLYPVMERQTKGTMLASVRDEYVFEVTDPPVVPQEKSKPRKLKALLIRLFSGFALGLLLSFFREMLRYEGVKPRVCRMCRFGR